MHYFKTISIICGILAVVKGIMLYRFTEQWSESEMNRLVPETQPVWTYAAGLPFLLVIIYTWFKMLVAPVPYALLVGIVLTIPILKIWDALFRYAQFRNWSLELANHQRDGLKQLTWLFGGSGIILLLMGFFVF